MTTVVNQFKVAFQNEHFRKSFRELFKNDKFRDQIVKTDHVFQFTRNGCVIQSKEAYNGHYHSGFYVSNDFKTVIIDNSNYTHELATTILKAVLNNSFPSEKSTN